MKISIDLSEKELENALLKAIPKKFPVKIIKNQYEISGGIIDILAKSTEYKDTYFIFELKLGDITPDSVCQVLRYSQYMNSEKSKDGKRHFYPVLIGKNIDYQSSNGHLYKLLKIFEGEKDDIFYVQYSLYNLGLNGLELNWIDTKNEEFIEENYNIYNCHIENKQMEIDGLDYNYYKAENYIKNITEAIKSTLDEEKIEQIRQRLKEIKDEQ